MSEKTTKQDKTIYFSIPGFAGQRQAITGLLLDLMQLEKNKFNDDIKIDSVYDSFDCIWDGGRGAGGMFDTNTFRECVNYYRIKGISIRQTFTNMLIDADNIHDTVGNKILELASAEPGLNGVTVNSELLADYIKQNYPNLYIVWSTTLGANPIDKVNELSKDDMLVLYYGMNNKWEDLEKLEHPEHIEILATEACIDNCPNRKKHYMSMSKSFMHKEEYGETPFTCPYSCESYDSIYGLPASRKHHVTLEDMREKYLPLGINHFKITGRNDSPINLIENYIIYLVKPEYQNEIRSRMLNKLFCSPSGQDPRAMGGCPTCR